MLNTVNSSYLSFISSQSSNKDSTQEDERVNLSHFNILGQIGKGAFGDVYLVTRKSSYVKSIMKVLPKSKIFRQNLIKYALTERNILSLNDHPFIVKLQYAFQSNEELFLIMEYCQGGDLSHYIKRERSFNEKKAKFYLCQVVLALEYLHSKKISHRDIKP